MGIQKIGSGLSIFSLVLFFLCGAGQICQKAETVSVNCHSQTTAEPKPCDCPTSKQEWQEGERGKESFFNKSHLSKSHSDSFFSMAWFPGNFLISESKINELHSQTRLVTPIEHFLETVKLLN